MDRSAATTGKPRIDVAGAIIKHFVENLSKPAAPALPEDVEVVIRSARLAPEVFGDPAACFA